MAQTYEIDINRYNGTDYDTLLPTPATHAATHQADGNDPLTCQTGNYGDKTVTGAKMADGTVGATQLASNAVTTAKITDANVTRDKLANDALYSPVTEVSDATYNLVVTDIGKTIKCTNTSGCTITISDNVFAALPIGAEIAVLPWIHNDTNHVIITLGSSYYMNKPGAAGGKGGSATTNTRYGMVALKKVTSASLLVTGPID